jgi:hypothetical protein
MAYASSRRSYQQSSRGGGNNTMAMAIAAVLVLGVIVALIAVSGGKKPTPPEEPPAPPPAAPAAAAPVKPAAPKPPDLPPGKLEAGRALVASFATKAAEAKKLLDESQKAKAAGKDDEWQSKLRDANRLASDINDEWNEFEASLPTNKDFDQDAVSAHYFKRERGQVQTYVKDVKRSMKTDERLR